MRRAPGRLILLAQALLALVVVTACQGDGGEKAGPPQPDPAQTLKQSAQAMAALKSIAFTLTTEDKPPIPVSGGDMKLLKSGDAQGALKLEQSGQTVQMDIVAVGDSIYIKGVTGGWRKVSKMVAATLYDPSAVLDPNRGISRLLNSVQSPKAETTEKVNGKDAYRVAVKLPQAALGGLVPGITSDLDGQVWVSTADHRLLKVRGDVPGEGGKGSVIINFTEFDAPYKISAPA
ncbi:LppX_LprAFG lipoprotein [Actinomadura hibisca]|uniref:LppX_LprAFG lipoprotein n=1 Tax=Actinomadura hibisca TaxID=68565 RepID=UPI0008362FF1|nr:LppX_LprAFG lipoprotein [Actinomadura hibisca]